MNLASQLPGIFAIVATATGLPAQTNPPSSFAPTNAGQEFEIQGVSFQGVEECRPCYWMNRAFGDERAESWLKGRGGLRARILTSGTLSREAAPR